MPSTRAKKGILQLGSRNHRAQIISLAGRICGLHGQRPGPSRGAGLHRRTGRASSREIIPGGTAGLLAEIRRRIRRALSRLIPPPLASRRDALFPARKSGGVASLTTGYTLRSLRLHHTTTNAPMRKPAAKPATSPPAHGRSPCAVSISPWRKPEASQPVAGGRGAPATTPPDHDPQKTRTPGRGASPSANLRINLRSAKPCSPTSPEPKSASKVGPRPPGAPKEKAAPQRSPRPLKAQFSHVAKDSNKNIWSVAATAEKHFSFSAPSERPPYHRQRSHAHSKSCPPKNPTPHQPSISLSLLLCG